MGDFSESFKRVKDLKSNFKKNQIYVYLFHCLKEPILRQEDLSGNC